MAARDWKDHLPPDASKDLFDMIAKALYVRYMRRCLSTSFGDVPMIVELDRDELLAAGALEFEYDRTPDGALIFRPVDGVLPDCLRSPRQ